MMFDPSGWEPQLSEWWMEATGEPSCEGITSVSSRRRNAERDDAIMYSFGECRPIVATQTGWDCDCVPSLVTFFETSGPKRVQTPAIKKVV
jgi:hypothetical protein